MASEVRHPLAVAVEVVGKNTAKFFEKNVLTPGLESMRMVKDISIALLGITFVPAFFGYMGTVDKEYAKGVEMNSMDIIWPAFWQTLRVAVTGGAMFLGRDSREIFAIAAGLTVGGILDAGILGAYYIGYRERAKQTG